MGHCSDILVVDKKSEIETAVEEHTLYNFGLYHGNLKILSTRKLFMGTQ